MFIMTATHSTVSRASAGWRDHQVSVLVMFSVRTFGSEIGRSLSHLLKALTAKVGGMCSVSQGLTVVGPTKRQEGSNDGGGGVGLVELFIKALWMGVVAGLDAEGPVLGGVAVSPGSSPAR